MIYKAIIIYLISINVLSAAVVVFDKLSAIYGKRRVRERTLFLFAIFGGGLLEYITMLLIRHKTRHLSFMIGIPAIFIIELLLAYLIVVSL